MPTFPFLQYNFYNRLSEEEIQKKVDAFRSKLIGTNQQQNGNDVAKDDYGRPM